MNASERGRALLHRWEDARPESFYEDDGALRAMLATRLGAERLARIEPALRQAGVDSAGPVNAAAGELDRADHLPRLERWSAVGERTEEVVFHPLHHDVGRLVWRSGILSVLGEPGRMTEHATLGYLFAQNGEVPHLCSVGCTAGLVKVLQRAGTDWMRREWLPRLLDPEYERRWHGAQFLTEVQGGSDVGANACVATPVDRERGVWRISGEKWFCSNVGAELYAMSARPDGASDGTPGLALFVVPRQLEDGRPNGVRIRRLKSKLGTRTLPTAEVDFEGARAFQVGRLEDGFKLLMGLVINTSRVEVAVTCAGMMRRAWSEASRYATLREAFGRRLLDFPAVRQQLAEMRTLGAAGLAFTLWVTALEDRLVLGGGNPEDDPLYRVAVNVNKYACATDAWLVVHHAIEILGGNGTIEDLSPLPRLYREVPVQESWEGPHNTLMAQILRDAFRSKMHAALLDAARDLALGVRAPALVALRERALETLEDARGRMDELLRGGPDSAAWQIRSLVGRIARLFQATVLLDLTQHESCEKVTWFPAAAELLLAYAGSSSHVADDPRTPDLVGRILTEMPAGRA
jgi:alkylation response protein AidB-like acyl-CoA dehydrogenase